MKDELFPKPPDTYHLGDTIGFKVKNEKEFTDLIGAQYISRAEAAGFTAEAARLISSIATQLYDGAFRIQDVDLNEQDEVIYTVYLIVDTEYMVGELEHAVLGLTDELSEMVGYDVDIEDLFKNLFIVVKKTDPIEKH
ncbi:hypothetical protein KC845_01875 [Candidatus Kaiserbacteria bacterium]|nr:hypothetical protein [Candidatus Kaiserbacteria bacterium]